MYKTLDKREALELIHQLLRYAGFEYVYLSKHFFQVCVLIKVALLNGPKRRSAIRYAKKNGIKRRCISAISRWQHARSS